MNQSQFTKVFSLRLFHSYFEGGVSNSWSYSPDEISLMIMGKYNFKIANNNAGFDLYVNTSETISEYLKYIEKAVDRDYFEFNINTSDSSLFMATDTPVDQVGYLAFDNQSDENLTENNIVKLTGVWTPTNESNVFATLRIYFDEIIKNSDSNVQSEYEIHMEARSTQWQYLIINQSGLELENLQVIGKNDVQFEGPQNVELQNGQQALKFYSGGTLIPLAQIPSHIFDLVTNNGSAIDKIIVKGLPNPFPDQFETTEFNGNTLVASPMYIYI